MVVRARFALADGTVLTGYVYPPPPNVAAAPDFSWNFGMLQPVIVVDEGQIRMWFGMFPPPEEVFQRLLSCLGKTMKQVFPLTYESDVELVGGPVNGVVMGFSFLNRGNGDVMTF